MLARGAIAAMLIALAAPAAAAPPEPEGTPIVIGRSFALPSRVLGDTRRINVWLPPSYADGTKRYPVLVLLDGGVGEDFLHIAGLAQITSAYGEGRELIVVGVEGVDRKHDLTPASSDPADRKLLPTSGGAADYRRFLVDELKPWIASHYRTDGHAALIGESLGGLFVLDTLLARPDAFDDYIAVSPSLWWDGGALGGRADDLAAALGTSRRLFVAFERTADSDEIPPAAQAAVARLEPALRRTPRTIVLRMPDERHSTIYHPAALAAFRAFYGIRP